MAELGINFIQILAYLVIFFLLYFFLRKFVKQVLDNLEKRKSTIDEGIKNANEAQNLKAEKLKEAEGDKAKVLEQAYNEAKEIVERAKTKEQAILNEAGDAKEAFLMHAKKEIEETKEKSKQEGLQEANEIMALAIRKAFEGIELDKKQEESYIKKSLDNLK